MATMLLLSHHAFRRDIMRFIQAVEQIKSGDASRAEAVRGEWETGYRQALHGHHVAEDTNIFPDLIPLRFLIRYGSCTRYLTDKTPSRSNRI